MRALLRRLGLLTLGLLLAILLLEVGLRATGLAVRAQAGVFALNESGTLGLRPCAQGQVRRPDGRVTTVATDGLGLRSSRECSPTPAADTLVIGDSQVFGLGVEADETFAARLGALNGGVPDFAVVDALAWGSGLLARPELAAVRRVVVVANQSNDFDDGSVTSAARNVVRGGYLLRRDRLSHRAASLWSTPLVHSALFYAIWRRTVLPPADPPGAWLTDPASVVPLATRLGEAVREFARLQPSRTVQLVWLPADLATSEENARLSVLLPDGSPADLRLWESAILREALAGGWQGPVVDLGPALTPKGSFLEHDYHLSEQGHSAVAASLVSHNGER